jgi:hypothetical protein
MLFILLIFKCFFKQKIIYENILSFRNLNTPENVKIETRK